MRRKTERILVTSYVTSVAALTATGAWVQQREWAALPEPNLLKRAETVRQRAPDFVLEDVTGKSIGLADLRGEKQDRPVVLEWFDPRCDWTETYHKKSSMMRDLYEEFCAEGAIGWAAIHSTPVAAGEDPAEIGRAAADEWGIRYPVLIDGDGSVADLYKVERAPYVFVISADGAIVYKGAVDDSTTPGDLGSQNHLRRALEAVRNGEDPVPGVTASPGCRFQRTGGDGADPDQLPAG